MQADAPVAMPVRCSQALRVSTLPAAVERPHMTENEGWDWRLLGACSRNERARVPCTPAHHPPSNPLTLRPIPAQNTQHVIFPAPLSRCFMHCCVLPLLSLGESVRTRRVTCGAAVQKNTAAVSWPDLAQLLVKAREEASVRLGRRPVRKHSQPACTCTPFHIHPCTATKRKPCRKGV